MSRSNNIRTFDLLSKLKQNKTEVLSIIIKEENHNFQKRKVLLPCGQQGRGEESQKGFGSDGRFQIKLGDSSAQAKTFTPKPKHLLGNSRFFLGSRELRKTHKLISSWVKFNFADQRNEGPGLCSWQTLLSPFYVSQFEINLERQASRASPSQSYELIDPLGLSLGVGLGFVNQF